MIEPSAGRPGERAETEKPALGIPPPGRLASSGTIVVTMIGVVLLALAPILIYPLPPLADYPNHLARMHVIATIGSDPDLSRHYDIHWQIIPNLIMDIVVPLFGRVTDIYHAGQAFTVICFVLLATGIFALNRALFGGWSMLGIAALPFLYNRIFFLGYMNYWFGVGLAMWAAAAWALLRERPWPWRLFASTLFAVALFFSHLIAVGIYGMALLAFELWRLWDRRSAPPAIRLADFAATGLPFLPLVALLLASPTWGLSGRNAWSLSAKLEGLSFAFTTYSGLIDLAIMAAIAALLAWAAFRRELRVHPAGWVLLGLGAVVYLAMPNIMFDTYVADERLPIAIVLAAIAFTTLDVADRLPRYGIVLVLLALLVLRVVEVAVTWRDLSRQTADVRASTRFIAQRGARVLVAQTEDTSENEAFDYGLAHAGCLAIIERSAFVANAFVFPGKQIMDVRPAYRRIAELADGDLPYIDELAEEDAMAAPSTDDAPYWQQWQNNFDYIYVMFTHRGEPNPLPELLTLLYDGNRFQLYKIRRAGP
jgi:hypothetical protein